MPKLLGYAWVSTTEPNVAPQRDAFTRASCWKVLPDQVTGWLGVAGQPPEPVLICPAAGASLRTSSW